MKNYFGYSIRKTISDTNWYALVRTGTHSYALVFYESDLVPSQMGLEISKTLGCGIWVELFYLCLWDSTDYHPKEIFLRWRSYHLNGDRHPKSELSCDEQLLAS